MTPSFTIETGTGHSSESKLILEAGQQGISYVALDENDRCTRLASWQFPQGIVRETANGHISQILQKIDFLQQPFRHVQIVYAFPEVLPVPAAYRNSATYRQMLELVFGELVGDNIYSDSLVQDKLFMTYAVPEVISDMLNRQFQGATHIHQQSIIAGSDGFTNGHHLYCIMGNSSISVSAFRNGQLQLARHYAYKTPEDAAFHLLNCCERFDIPVDECTIHLNGMIDESSNLYRELYKYFRWIEFGKLPDQFQYPDEMHNYPAHFFSHLFMYASCV